MKRFSYAPLCGGMLELADETKSSPAYPVYVLESEAKEVFAREQSRADAAFDRVTRMTKDRDEWRESTANAQARATAQQNRADKLDTALSQENAARATERGRMQADISKWVDAHGVAAERIAELERTLAAATARANGAEKERDRLLRANENLVSQCGLYPEMYSPRELRYQEEIKSMGLEINHLTLERNSLTSIQMSDRKEIENLCKLSDRQRDEFASLSSEASKLRRFFEAYRSVGCSLDDYDKRGYGRGQPLASPTWPQATVDHASEPDQTVRYWVCNGGRQAGKSDAAHRSDLVRQLEQATKERDEARAALRGKVAPGQFVLMVGEGCTSEVEAWNGDTLIRLRTVKK